MCISLGGGGGGGGGGSEVVQRWGYVGIEVMGMMGRGGGAAWAVIAM